LIFLVSGTVAAVGFVFFREPSDLWVFRRVVLISGAGLGFSVPMRVFFGFLNASFRFDISAAIEILAVLVRSACIVLFLRSGFGIVALAWSHLAAALTTLLLVVLWSRKVAGGLHFGIHFFRWSRCKELLSYGSISLVAQVADLLRFQVDAFVVAGFVGLAAVTHYNIAGSMAQYFISFMLAATGTLGPLFSQLESGNHRERMLEVLRLSTRVAVGLAGFVGFEFIVLGRPFIHRWMGPGYWDAYPALLVLTLALLPPSARPLRCNCCMAFPGTDYLQSSILWKAFATLCLA
jgi:O-antigen/teichoic acid export membrane protein